MVKLLFDCTEELYLYFVFLVDVYWSKTDRSATAAVADTAASLAQTVPVIL